MKVLEVKNNLVKISYEEKENLVLSGFVVIEDETTPYVAQIVNLRADATSNFAIVKLLFTFNEEGILKNYNGSIPSTKATVSMLPSNELLDILPMDTPIKLGTLAQQDFELKVDESVFKKNLLICSNNQENTNILLDNFMRQFEKMNRKTVVFDINGEFDWEKKIKFGDDFKLPLNYETINYIYNNDLEDVDATNKAIIQDIFIELQEYTKTLPEGFIPFDSFFTVVDQQYKETGITQLVLLKNKLLKYRDAEVFAQNLKDMLNLSIMIEKNDILVIDISMLSPKLQNEVMSYTYDVMKKIDSQIYSFIKAENRNITKKLLKRIINEKNNINSTVICGHDFKYLNELKQSAENMILFAPLTLQHDFASYNTFLNKLNSDEFIVYGNLTQHIPLIVQLEKLNLEEEPEQDNISDEKENDIQIKQEDKIEKNDNIIPMPEIKEQKSEPEYASNIVTENIVNNEIDNEAANVLEKDTDISTEQELNLDINEPEMEEPEIILEEENQITEEDIQIPNNSSTETIKNENIIQENNKEEEINTSSITLSELDLEDAPIISEEIIDNEPIIEEIETPEEISIDNIKDLDDNDKQNTPEISETEIMQITAENDIDIIEEPIEADFMELPQAELNSDELTEDDLNFIDQINEQEDFDENISTEDILQAVDNASEQFETQTENIQQNSNSLPEPDFIKEQEQVPFVPVYSAENDDSEDIPIFEAGEEVTHPKYGRGVVEKMIKYGNKTLYSVNFHASGIGRRLLDPVITELKKLK